MKLLFVGDLHLSSENLSIRKDEYPSVILNKLEQTLDIGIEKKINMMIFGGDIFHNKKTSIGYFNKLLMLLRDEKYKFRKASTQGNHDMYNSKPETIEKTLLGTMYIDGTLLPKVGEWSIETDDTFILFLPYMLDERPPLHVNFQNKKTILVSHYFFNQPMFEKECIPNEYTQIFDFIMLGHDHGNYPIERVNKAMVIRPGALSRGTRHKDSFTRQVQVAFIDTETGEAEYIPLHVRPASEIFSIERMSRESAARESKLVSGLSESVSIQDGSDIEGLFESMPLEDKLKVNTKKGMIEGGII